MQILPAIARRSQDFAKLIRKGNAGPALAAMKRMAWVKDTSAGLLGYADPESSIVETNESEMSALFVVSTSNEDRDGDIVVPSGCVLEAYNRNPAWFWNHQQDANINMPIGTAQDPSTGQICVYIEPQRVLAKCWFDQGDPDAVFIYGKVCRGFIRATSIAFLPLLCEKREPRDRGDLILPAGYIYKQWELTENTICGVGANSEAIRASLDKDPEAKHITRKLRKSLEACIGPECVWSNGFTPARLESKLPRRKAVSKKWRKAKPVKKGSVEEGRAYAMGMLSGSAAERGDKAEADRVHDRFRQWLRQQPEPHADLISQFTDGTLEGGRMERRKPKSAKPEKAKAVSETVDSMRAYKPDQLRRDYQGATGDEWNQLRVLADRAGRMDLVRVCIDEAAAAYEETDKSHKRAAKFKAPAKADYPMGKVPDTVHSIPTKPEADRIANNYRLWYYWCEFDVGTDANGWFVRGHIKLGKSDTASVEKASDAQWQEAANQLSRLQPGRVAVINGKKCKKDKLGYISVDGSNPLTSAGAMRLIFPEGYEEGKAADMAQTKESDPDRAADEGQSPAGEVTQALKDQQACVSHKIPKLIDEGYDHEQAIAIAFHMCGEGKDVTPENTEEAAKALGFTVKKDKKAMDESDGYTPDKNKPEGAEEAPPDDKQEEQEYSDKMPLSGEAMHRLFHHHKDAHEYIESIKDQLEPEVKDIFDEHQGHHQERMDSIKSAYSDRFGKELDSEEAPPDDTQEEAKDESDGELDQETEQLIEEYRRGPDPYKAAKLIERLQKKAPAKSHECAACKKAAAVKTTDKRLSKKSMGVISEAAEHLNDLGGADDMPKRYKAGCRYHSEQLRSMCKTEPTEEEPPDDTAEEEKAFIARWSKLYESLPGALKN